MEENLSDNRVFVGNLQEMLRTLALVSGDERYETAVSGTFGEGTERALRYFQETHRLPVTGVVDLDTWTTLTECYEEALLSKNPPLGISPYPISRKDAVCGGEAGSLVYVIQVMLETLSQIYDFSDLVICGSYNDATTAAIRKFQETNGFPSPTGTVDRLTWNCMAEEYNHLVNDTRQ